MSQHLTHLAVIMMDLFSKYRGHATVKMVCVRHYTCVCLCVNVSVSVHLNLTIKVGVNLFLCHLLKRCI